MIRNTTLCKLHKVSQGLSTDVKKCWPGNRTFSSYSRPLFQSEAKCEAIYMKMSSYSHANKIHFFKKGFALSLVWKWEFLALGNCQFISNLLEQLRIKQDLDSVNVGHGKPSFIGSLSIARPLSWEPRPHVTEHAVHFVHRDTLQCTRCAKT